ncbi:S41 family peptidase [Siphonobacter sp. SORGH_AS_1065]|uniref:S41 family peptidase n=1 Tax=Siphonobacter sp. SORGH_AS_1065 TaxID=3041795 RepID=UPI00278BA309|nr:S41 family peptidase [Siphonobacter sp. SORGH_AS_1065]MDQ1089277.1 tricorn protease [Siphonobacter sp. SORGH_AS_1065]
MKKLVCSAILAVAGLSQLQAQDVYFTSYPTISPDAKTLVFTYENDLWKTDLATGISTRLTAMQGSETRARFSPDGKWLAFSGTQYGNNDIYLMPAEGGEIRQLTFHDGNDVMDSWGWDSKTIYFESTAFNGGTAYTISTSGGTPKRIFGHYFNRIHSVSEHPSSGELFFNDTWESDNQAYRKGYKGEFNPDIQSYNRKTKAYKRYTDYNGKDMWATIDKAGNVYFVSDEANGEYNLYTFVNGKKTALTSFKESVKRPQVSANGQKIIFERDYQLWSYDIASKKSEKVKLNISRNFTLPKAQDFIVQGNINFFDVSPDGKKMAFSSRGKLFVSDLEGKYVKQLNTRVDGRVLEVKWLSDNRTLVFNQTVNGYQNYFSIPADGNGDEKALTNDLRSNRNLSINKDRTKAVYLSGRDEVRLLDLKTFTSKTLVSKEEIWAFQDSSPMFSPNDEYIVFTSHRNFEQDIFIYKFADNKTYNLTNTGVTEASPYWSPDGKYIYFASNRLKPSYPFGMQDAHIYRMALSKIEAPYRSDKFDELFKKDDKKETKTDSSKTTDKKTKEETKPKEEPKKKEEAKKTEPIVIDFEGLMDRLEQISPNFGTAYDPIVIQKDSKTFVLYSSNHDQGRSSWWKTTLEPFVPTKTEKIEGTMRASDFLEASGKYYLIVSGNIHKLNLDANKVDKIDIQYTFRKNFADEFKQMFEETWANVEENFYNETFHGVDWKSLRTKYEAFVPRANNRTDFRMLMNDMLGELNSSHTGFSSFGPEETNFYSTRTLTSGLIFEDENPYQVKAIVKDSPLDKQDKDVKPGDILVKVNGEKVDAKQNRDFYFQQPSMDQEMTLTLERNGKAIEVKVHPESSGALVGQLYDEWIDQNQKYVDAKSKNRIAYVHMKNMGMDEYEKFVIDMTRDWNQKDALIMDLRYNTGGNVHDLVLNFLSQRPYLQWQYRGGARSPQPNFSPSGKPIVMLINEQSLSDAEMTSAGFKALKLGKLIGTETYRWIIFTSGKGLVDGSFYRLPSWGCYTLDGKNLEREGVQPDITVRQTFTDRLDGKEPQLDKAIEEILKELK